LLDRFKRAKMKNAQYWINYLDLSTHPEGGYFKERYRSKETFQPKGFNGKRNFLTSIYFLLEEGNVSHFHSINSDELWCYHAGDSLSIIILHQNGELDEIILGPNIENGEVLQAVVPAGSIFGSKSNGKYSLAGCVVSPGFDFQDFKLYSTSFLLSQYPKFEAIINELSQEHYL
jgi:predicted cupin superfamily sugar epimerase